MSSQKQKKRKKYDSREKCAIKNLNKSNPEQSHPFPEQSHPFPELVVAVQLKRVTSTIDST